MTRQGKISDWYNKDSEFKELFHQDTTHKKITNRTTEKYQNGFKILGQCGIDRSQLKDTKTERIVTIAQKQLK